MTLAAQDEIDLRLARVASNGNGQPHENGSRRERVSVVIPARNEAENVGWVLERVPSTVDEVVLVDGWSTDDTIAVARRARKDIVVVSQTRPGKGAALRAGFEAATGDFVVMLDADGSMDPAEIPRFIQPLRDGYDLVKGSRFLTGGGSADFTWFRLLGNRSLLWLVNRMYDCGFTDLCYGFMAFRRPALELVPLASEGFEVETEIVVRSRMARVRIAEVPSLEAPRRSGTSKLRPIRDGRRALQTLMRARVLPPLPPRETAPAAATVAATTTTTAPARVPTSVGA